MTMTVLDWPNRLGQHSYLIMTFRDMVTFWNLPVSAYLFLTEIMGTLPRHDSIHSPAVYAFILHTRVRYVIQKHHLASNHIRHICFKQKSSCKIPLFT